MNITGIQMTEREVILPVNTLNVLQECDNRQF